MIGRTRASVYIQKLTGLLLGPKWSCRTPTMREKLFILKFREGAKNDFISGLLLCVFGSAVESYKSPSSGSIRR